jgi:poly(3-hydroxybutyrate) depolymerase
LADPFIPYSGGKGFDASGSINFPPVESSIEKWRLWNGCAPAPQVSVQGPITHTVYSDCEANTAVELYTLGDFEHGWPQPTGYGELNFPATQTIWDFFVAHPKSSDD